MKNKESGIDDPFFPVGNRAPFTPPL